MEPTKPKSALPFLYYLSIIVFLSLMVFFMIGSVLIIDQLRRFIFHIPSQDILINYQSISLWGPIVFSIFGAIPLATLIFITLTKKFLPQSFHDFANIKMFSNYYSDVDLPENLPTIRSLDNQITTFTTRICLIAIFCSGLVYYAALSSYVHVSPDQITVRDALASHEKLLDLNQANVSLEGRWEVVKYKSEDRFDSELVLLLPNQKIVLWDINRDQTLESLKKILTTLAKYHLTPVWQPLNITFEHPNKNFTLYKEISTPPAPKPYVYHAPTEEQKLYALAMGAILSRYNNENITTLKSNLALPNLRMTVKDWWGITNRSSALEVLDWLKNEGHRTEYEQVYEVLVTGNITTCDQLELNTDKNCRNKDIANLHDLVARLHSQTENKSLYAWDYGRLINVARWCYTFDWISEEEAWQYIMPAAYKLQQTYASWQELGEHYIIGRAYWLRDEKANQIQKDTLKSLLDDKPYSYWSQIDWHTNLR